MGTSPEKTSSANVSKPTNTDEKSIAPKILEEKKEFEYEFGGPIGAFCTTLALPVITLVLIHFAKVGSIDFSFVSNPSDVLCPGCSSLPLLLKCANILLGWFFFLVLLTRILPAELLQGTVLKTDAKLKENRLTYRINGHLVFWVTMMILAIGYPTLKISSSSKGVEVVFRNVGLATLQDYLDTCALCTIGFCFLLSTFLYIKSFSKGALLAHGGNSGNLFYDFFMGRELNPRPNSNNIFLGNHFDWKEFCELRPGLIGWFVLNLAFLKKQYDTLGYISGSMMLINIFQGIYVWDALYQERAILTTMDITTDGFGFMLCYGDLGWVPFTYSLQAQYLVNHDPELGMLSLIGIILLYVFGYFIFRSANSQKDAFRRNPDSKDVAHLKFLQTKRGTKLLTSGWWGTARKINYTGDWIMGLSWCLTCGIDSIVPYYYAIYFAILLVHRSIRDDFMCQEKYGDDWDEYKKLVPYRFIPGII